MRNCDNGVAWAPVGRAAQFATVLARVDQAAVGDPGLVLVRGTAGSGKSTFLDLVRDIEGATVLHTRCHEVAAPFAAVRDLLTRFEGMAPTTALHVLRGEPVRSLGDEPTGEYPVLHGLHRLVADLAVERPLVLLLDDAHHCDSSTARWLDFTLRRAAGLRLLVVLSHQPDRTSVGGLLSTELSHHVRTTELDLGPLGRAPVAELVTRELGGCPDDAFLDACLEATGGSPMRLRDLLARLRTADVDPSWDAVDRVVAFGGAQAAASTARWLDGQTDAVRKVAEAAALLGGTRSATLGALCGLSAAVTSNAVAVLVHNDVVTADGGAFRHADVRDGVLAGIPAEDIGGLRVRAARLLSDEGRPFEEIAHQLMSVPVLNEPWMFCALREAAKAVAVGGAPEDAVRYLRRVLDAVPGHVDTRIELATVLAMTHPSAALDQFTDVLGDITDLPLRASVATRCGIAALAAHRVPDALPALRKALLDLPDDVHPDVRTNIETSLLVAGLADWETVGETVRWSRLLDVPPGNTPAQREMLQALARAEVLSGGSARTAAELARTDLRHNGDRQDWWAMSAATVLHLAGESTHSLDMADAVVRDSAGRHDAWQHYYALGVRGYVHFGMGDLIAAEADAEAAIAIADSAGWSDEASTSVTILAAVLVRREATARAGALLSSLGPPRGCTERSLRLLVRAQVLRCLGDREGAVELVLRCGREFDEAGLRDPIFAPWWLDAAYLFAELGRPAEAVEPVRRGEALAARWDTAEARGLALLARGVVTPGRAGLDLLEGAVAELADSPARLADIRALSSFGAALAAGGDLKSARGHLRTAVDMAIRCGDRTSANEVRSMLRRAGGRMPESSTSRADALTGGERRVASLAASGLSNREIAEALFIAVRTVESHLSNVYRKLGVQTRADLLGQLG